MMRSTSSVTTRQATIARRTFNNIFMVGSRIAGRPVDLSPSHRLETTQTRISILTSQPTDTIHRPHWDANLRPGFNCIASPTVAEKSQSRKLMILPYMPQTLSLLRSRSAKKSVSVYCSPSLLAIGARRASQHAPKQPTRECGKYAVLGIAWADQWRDQDAGGRQRLPRSTADRSVSHYSICGDGQRRHT